MPPRAPAPGDASPSAGGVARGMPMHGDPVTAAGRRTLAAALDERPNEGHYFVASWPPFERWDTAALPAFERRLEGAAPPAGFALYVHVPFCVERCDYCYYRAYDDRPEARGRYVDAVVRELEAYAGRPAFAGRSPECVYIGGGTPSLLAAAALRRLFGGLRAALPWDRVREVSFECAPKSTTAAKLALLRELGVTRLSLGVQSLDDGVLAQNGRVHHVADVERAWSAVREAGFAVTNLDLIVGLVGETDATFAASVGRALDLGADCLTIYQLEIPRGTPLARALREGRVAAPPASWGVKRDRLAAAFERLESAGYTLRSGYTAVRDPRRHGFVYQDIQYGGADLLGLGVASFSYLDGIGVQNSTALDAYLEAVEGGRLPLGRARVLDADERLTRELVLGLKLGAVEREGFVSKFGVDVAERFAPGLAALAREGLVEVTPSAVRLTRAGLLRVDHLIAEGSLLHARP